MLSDLFKNKNRASGVKKIVATAPPTAHPPAKQPTAEVPITQDDDDDHITLAHTQDYIAVEELSGDGEDSQVVSEAAILFANYRADQAIALIEAHLQAIPEEMNHDVWHALFELYHTSNMIAAYDTLSRAFTKHFGISPPAWPDATEAGQARTAPAITATPSDYIAIKGELGVGARPEIERIMAECASNATLRISLTQVSKLTQSGCDLLLDAIQFSYKKKVQLQWIVEDQIMAALIATLTDTAFAGIKSNWAIVFDIYQFQNRRDDFDNLSIDYAVALEESPPIWHDWRVSTGAVNTNDVPAAEPYIPFPVIFMPDNEQAFIAPQEITMSTDFEDLAEYANSTNAPVIDMIKTRRIDFSAAGNFCAAIATIASKGKSVSITNASQMVNSILKTFEIHSMARIEKRRVN